MIINFKKIIFVIISASFFITFSFATKADLNTHAKTYLAPVMAARMTENKMLKDTPFCKGFDTKDLVVNWAVQTYLLYVYSAKSALEIGGRSKSCGTMDLYENRFEKKDTAMDIAFSKKSIRYQNAMDLFVQRCFINGDALYKDMHNAAMQTAKKISCEDLSLVSKNVADATRNFN
jgi:hypothetical protein